MNEIKGTTLRDRLKAAFRAFQGKPAHQIRLGLKVERCDKCERGDCPTCAYKNEFDKLMSLPNCNDCADKNCCDFAPKPGEYVRANCPLHKKKEAK